MASLVVDRFDGGIYDEPESAPPGGSEVCDNLVISSEGKLEVRPGSRLLTETHLPQSLVADARGLSSLNDESSIVALTTQSAYVFFGDSWSLAQPVDPLSTPFSGLSAGERFEAQESQRHLYFTPRDNSTVTQKLYKNSTGGYSLRSAGLPKIESDPVVTGSLYTLDAYIAAAGRMLVEHGIDAPTTSIAKVGSISGSGTTRTITLQTPVRAMVSPVAANTLWTEGTEIVFSASSTDNGSTRSDGGRMTITSASVTFEDDTRDPTTGPVYPKSVIINSITGTVTNDTGGFSNPSAGHFIYVKDFVRPSSTTGIHKESDRILIEYVESDQETPPSIQKCITGVNELVAAWNNHVREIREYSFIGSKPTTLYLKNHVGYNSGERLNDDVSPLDVETIASNATVEAVWDKVRSLVQLIDTHDRDVNETGVSTAGAIYGNTGAHKEGALNGKHQSGGYSEIADYQIGRYLYAFLRKSEYETDLAKFLDVSATRIVQAAGGFDVISDGTVSDRQPAFITISEIPELTNSGSTCYDAQNTKVQVYRTTTNGTVFRLVAEIDNGVTQYVDTMTDEDLVGKEQIYTTGGVLDNDLPPRAKSIHAVGTTMFYLNVEYPNESFPYRLVQSVPGDPDSVPEGNYVDFPSEGRVVSSVRNIPVVITASGVYRIDGQFDELGRGGMTATEIHSYADCIPGSAVKTVDGLIWWGSDGVYGTDGYNVRKLSSHIDDKYSSWINEPFKTSGMISFYDSAKRRVIWGVRSSESVLNPDLFVVLEVDATNQSRGCFYTWSGFQSAGFVQYRQKLVRADENSHLLVHSSGLTSDVKTTGSEDPTDSYPVCVIPSYLGASLKLDNEGRQAWVTSLRLRVNDDSSAILMPRGRNNSTGSTHDLAQITLGRGRGVTVEGRRFPAGTLRARHKQVGFTFGEKTILSSADFSGEGKLTVMGNGKLVAQLSPPNVFSQAVLGQFLILSSDPESTRRRIVAVAADWVQVEFYDDLSLLSEHQFLVVGTTADAQLKLLSYELVFEPMSKSLPESAGVTE